MNKDREEIMKIHSNNLQALKNYVDDPMADDSLKMDILGWMYDNLQIINNPKKHNPNYYEEVQIFLQLINTPRVVNS